MIKLVKPLYHGVLYRVVVLECKAEVYGACSASTASCYSSVPEDHQERQ